MYKAIANRNEVKHRITVRPRVLRKSATLDFALLSLFFCSLITLELQASSKFNAHGEQTWHAEVSHILMSDFIHVLSSLL